MNTMSRTVGSCLLLTATALATIALDADAQPTVYRCGQDGREYSSTPCPGGRAVPVDDARSAEQQQQARDAAQREAKLADQLARERRQREHAAKPTKPGALSARHHPPDATASRPATSKKPKRRASAPADPTLSAPVKVPAKS